MPQIGIRSLIPFALLSTINALSAETSECAHLGEVVEKLHLAPSADAYCSSILQLSTVTVTDTLTMEATEVVTSTVETVPTSVLSVTESVTAETVSSTASAVVVFVTETTVTSDCPRAPVTTIVVRDVYSHAPVVVSSSTTTSCTGTGLVASKEATPSSIEYVAVGASSTSVAPEVSTIEEPISTLIPLESRLSSSSVVHTVTSELWYTPSEAVSELWPTSSSIASEPWSTYSGTTITAESSSIMSLPTPDIPVACKDAPIGLQHFPCPEITKACSCIVSAPTSTVTATVSAIETSTIISTVTMEVITVTATLTDNIVITEIVTPTSTSTIVETITTICPAPTCAPPTTMCESQCLDLTSDPLNCGACGNVCPNGTCRNSVCLDRRCSGQTCDTFTMCGAGGSCVCASSADTLGVCADGQTPCAGLADCGADGSCEQGFVCVVGTCCSRDICIRVADQCVNNVVPRKVFVRRPAKGSTIGF